MCSKYLLFSTVVVFCTNFAPLSQDFSCWLGPEGEYELLMLFLLLLLVENDDDDDDDDAYAI